MSDISIKLDAVMGELGKAWCDWINLCARSVDPRDIAYLTRVVYVGCPDRETMKLRNKVIGEWRIERVGHRMIAKAWLVQP